MHCHITCAVPQPLLVAPEEWTRIVSLVPEIRQVCVGIITGLEKITGLLQFAEGLGFDRVFEDFANSMNVSANPEFYVLWERQHCISMILHHPVLRYVPIRHC